MHISLKRVLGAIIVLIVIHGIVSAQPMWVREFKNGFVNGASTDLKVTASGKVFAASGTLATTGRICLNFAIYDAATGARLREVQFPFVADEIDVADMAVNSREETYVLSTFFNFNAAQSHEVFLTKLDRTGRLLWNQLLAYSEAYALELDTKENVVVGIGDYNILKLDPDGKFLWSGGGHNTNGGYLYMIPRAIKIDSLGNIYALALAEYGGTPNYMLDVAKFNSAGTSLWAVQLGGIASSQAQNNATFTLNGGIFVATPVDTPYPGILVSKLSSTSGTLQWQTIAQTYGATYWAAGIEYYRDPQYRQGVVTVIAQDDQNAVATNLDAGFGFVDWSVSYPAYLPRQGYYQPHEGAKVDSCGNFLVGARDLNGIAGLLSFDRYGTVTFDSIGYGMDPATGLAIDSANNVYLGGEGPTQIRPLPRCGSRPASALPEGLILITR